MLYLFSEGSGQPPGTLWLTLTKHVSVNWCFLHFIEASLNFGCICHVATHLWAVWDISSPNSLIFAVSLCRSVLDNRASHHAQHFSCEPRLPTQLSSFRAKTTKAFSALAFSMGPRPALEHATCGQRTPAAYLINWVANSDFETFSSGLWEIAVSWFSHCHVDRTDEHE